VIEILRNLHRNGATICMVTHDPRYSLYADRTVRIFDGRVVEEQMHFTVGELGEARIVRDHADGGAVLVQFFQQLHDCFAVAGVEVSGRLIRKQDGGRPSQRAGDSDTLLLTAGELRGIVAKAMRHADAAQRLIDAAFALGGGHAGTIGERELDIFIDGEIADQIETLKDETNLLIANA
jgi:energy-coupling factor transporter ATP-binding protein EcfA2